MKLSKKFALCLLVLVTVLSSCSSSKTVFSCGSAKITDSMFSFTLSYYKTQYLSYSQSSSGSSNTQLTDDPTFWEQTSDSSDGKTLGEVLKNNVIDNEKMFVYLASRAGELGVSLNDDEIAEVDKAIESLQANIGDDKAFNVYLNDFGIDKNELREMRLQETLAQKVQLSLFKTGGEEALTADSVLKYYEENYVSVKHILINSINYTAANGKVVVLPDAEKAQKDAKIASIMSRLDAGESFEALMSESEDTSLTADSDAYTFAKGEMSIAEYENAAFDMKAGEIRSIETSNGTVIIKKYPLANITDDIASSVQNAIVANRSDELLAAAEDDIQINQELIDSYEVTDLPIMN